MNSASMIRLNPNNPSVAFLLVLVTCLQPTVHDDSLPNQLITKQTAQNESIKKTKTELTAQTASACEAGTARHRRRRRQRRRSRTIGGAWWRRKAGPLGKADDEQEQSNGRSPREGADIEAGRPAPKMSEKMAGNRQELAGNVPAFHCSSRGLPAGCDVARLKFSARLRRLGSVNGLSVPLFLSLG